jgi:hypothetical protein
MIAYKNALETRHIYLSLMKNSNEQYLLQIDDMVDAFEKYRQQARGHATLALHPVETVEGNLNRESIVNSFKVSD